MDDPTLVPPSSAYRPSFLEALLEYQKEYGETGNDRLKRYANLNHGHLNRDGTFEQFLETLRSQVRGEGLPEGYIPNSVFWLVEGDEFIGWVDIRHRLTTQLLQIGGHIGYDVRPSQRGKGYGKLALKLALEKARQLGIEKILVTCDISNIPSKRVIETNGGVFESEAEAGQDKPKKLRYWIR